MKHKGYDYQVCPDLGGLEDGTVAEREYAELGYPIVVAPQEEIEVVETFSAKELARVVDELERRRSSRVQKQKRGETGANPLRHAGDRVYPLNNTPAKDHKGRQCTLECGVDGFFVIRGSGARDQDKLFYHVPPSLRGFVDELLTAYEKGVWTRPPDLGVTPKGKPRKWRPYCKGLSAALLEIVQSQPNGKGGYTGNVRLWIE